MTTANAFADLNAVGNLCRTVLATLANVAWNVPTEAHRTNLALRARIATIHTAVRIAMFANKIAKTAERRYKIAPRVTAPILGQGMTAKRAILPAKTAEQQTKNAPLATALPTGQGIIVIYVIFRRQIAAMNKISILSIACAFVKMTAIQDIIALIPAHRQQRAAPLAAALAVALAAALVAALVAALAVALVAALAVAFRER